MFAEMCRRVGDGRGGQAAQDEAGDVGLAGGQPVRGEQHGRGGLGLGGLDDDGDGALAALRSQPGGVHGSASGPAAVGIRVVGRTAGVGRSAFQRGQRRRDGVDGDR